jgi:hypothetical protein
LQLIQNALLSHDLLGVEKSVTRLEIYGCASEVTAKYMNEKIAETGNG